MVDFFECFILHCYEGEVGEIKQLVKKYDAFLPRTSLDAKKEAHKEPLIEDIIENPPHDAIEDLECAQVSVSDDDNTYTPDLSQEETITKIYMLGHFLQFPQGGMNMCYKKI